METEDFSEIVWFSYRPYVYNAFDVCHELGRIAYRLNMIITDQIYMYITHLDVCHELGRIAYRLNMIITDQIYMCNELREVYVRITQEITDTIR